MAEKTTQTAELAKRTETIFDLVRKQKEQIAVALPKHMDADKLIRIVTTELRKNPKLAECSKESLLGAMMVSAQLGLEVGVLGHCYFIPQWNSKTRTSDVRFEVGYKGLLKLARNSGEISALYSDVVCENDEFDINLGTDHSIKHKIDFKNPNGRGKEILYYAVVKYKDGTEDFEYMTLADIDKRRKASQGGDSEYSPWVKWTTEMAKKTVLKKLCQRLPLSPEIERNIARDTQVNKFDIETGEVDSNYIDGEVIESKPDALALAIKDAEQSE